MTEICEFKKHYMDIRLDFGEKYNNPEISMDLAQFKYAIFLALKSLHGDMGCSVPVDVLKYRSDDRRAFIRFPSKELVKVWSALTLFSSYQDLGCMFRVYKVTPLLANLNLNSNIYKHKEKEKCTD
ncbi:uncharacterized protein TNCT_191171 [Trichonephila clavata]|uniref:Ribonucleases P/MRP subunit Pop8-like domain-containing protein n=1 Tax=Trichonephila clavata TaxID=2740835 RepID=A0A8X6M0S9_TRICU|nr:uncharacterized protein TNCT_191171 [Trichonephila clavata]